MPENAPPSFDSMQSEISDRMNKQLMTPRMLLGGMRLIDESSRMSVQYQDPNYLPFYFHVGRVFDPKKVVCVGLDLGLHISCLLKGCSSPSFALCIQPQSEEFYSSRLALSNIKSVAGRKFPVEIHIGRPHDQRPQSLVALGFDAAIVTNESSSDKLMEAMDFCWKGLRHGGVMAVDHLTHRENEEVFEDFCRGRSASHCVFRTRYKVGMAMR